MALLSQSVLKIEAMKLSEIRKNHRCNSRDLHVWLEISDSFKRWTKGSIYSARWGFEKFIINDSEVEEMAKTGSQEARPLTMKAKEVEVKLAKLKGTTFASKIHLDYELSLEFAKNIAMVSGGAKGQEARDYFIRCEQALIQQAEKNLKIGAMLLEHKDKLKLTKNSLYPILNDLGVLTANRKGVHEHIIKHLIGKWENVNQYDKLDLEKFKKLYRDAATDYKIENADKFDNNLQITIDDILNMTV